jgi:hypothetical protein
MVRGKSIAEEELSRVKKLINRSFSIWNSESPFDDSLLMNRADRRRQKVKLGLGLRFNHQISL